MPLVDEGEHAIDVEIAVQVDVAVVRTVMACVLLEEVLVGGFTVLGINDKLVQIVGYIG